MTAAIWRSLLFALITTTIASCATGGQADPGHGDAPVKTDAPVVHRDATTPPGDAKVFHDAPAGPDAFVFLDAPASSGGFCSSNSDCHTPGECCFVVACTHGIVVGSTCLPQ